jgi:methionyl-tRNA formyltransferase
MSERSPLRVVFAGTPEFAAAALAAIHGAGHTVPLVLTQPDRPAGRGMKLTPSLVKQLALAHGLALAQPQGLKLDGKFAVDAAAARAALEAASPDVMVVAAYGLILPQWVLTLPRLGCLNIHASLLPRWRGAAPIHRAIEAGDAETGITIMQMDEGLDTGAMLAIGREPIHPDDSTGALHDRLAALGARMIVTALADAAAGRLRATPQPEAGVTYAHKISKAEAAIDWALPAATIERRVRAFDPFPGASFECGGEVVKLWQARVCPEVRAPAGRVLRADGEHLVVACGDGGLELLQLQRPGGKRLPVAAFLQARPGLGGSDLPSGAADAGH